MGKKNPHVTPRSRVRAALRQLWLRSRERASALKRDQYTCQGCRKKQSRTKGHEFYVNVHHKRGIDWDGIIDIVIERILQTPDDHITLCDECHDKEHEKDESNVQLSERCDDVSEPSGKRCTTRRLLLP